MDITELLHRLEDHLHHTIEVRPPLEDDPPYDGYVPFGISLYCTHPECQQTIFDTGWTI